MSRRLRVGLIKAAPFQARLVLRFGSPEEQLRRLLSDPIFEIISVDGRADTIVVPDDIDAFVISGAMESAYAELPWIQRLCDVVRGLHRARIPLLGICFGHQLIAYALGGEVAPSPRGWEIGVQPITWLDGGPSSRVYMSHEDEVVRLPDGAVQLARNDFSEHQAYAIDGTVMCIQGHPDFTPEVSRYYLQLNDIGLSDRQLTAALDSLALGDDHDTVGRMLADFLIRGCTNGSQRTSEP